MGAEFRLVRCATPGVQAVVARSGHDFPPHTHQEFGIGVITAGAQRWHSGRRPAEAGTGTAIAVNPEEVHDGAPVDGRERAWCMIYLRPDLVLNAVGDLSEGRAGSFEIPEPVIGDRRAAPLLLELVREESAGRLTLRTEELLLALLARLGAPRPGKTNAPPAPIAAARARIDDDPAGVATLQQLADLGGLSRFQLLRGFVRTVGLTPHAYLVQRRADLAKSLIAEGSPLAAAAAKAGFADQSHMTRVFTRKYGFTPGAFADAFRRDAVGKPGPPRTSPPPTW